MMHARPVTSLIAIAQPRLLIILAALAALLLPGCVLSKSPRSERDPYVIDSSSDPQINAGNPY